MSDIKEGALVKAWDDDLSDYVVGKYCWVGKLQKWPHVVDTCGLEPFKNAIEIPDELAAQLESLGAES